MNFRALSTPTQRTAGLAFLATLIGFMMLNYYYWTQLQIGTMLLYFAALGVNAIFMGSKTLGELAVMRFSSEKKEK